MSGYYKTCPRCGANLDPGEKCDCDKYSCMNCCYLRIDGHCDHRGVDLTNAQIREAYTYMRPCWSSGNRRADARPAGETSMLNEHGTFALQVAKNHGISVDEAYELPIVKAHKFFLDHAEITEMDERVVDIINRALFGNGR